MTDKDTRPDSISGDLGASSVPDVSSVPLLARRRIEAEIVGPLLARLSEEFDGDRVLELAREAIREISRDQGARLSELLGSDSLEGFVRCLEFWKQDGALEIRMLEQGPTRLFFDVVRCRYAEMYRELGMQDLGATLSCCRDAELAAGFNSNITLERTQTIMQGAAFCDFRFYQPGESSE